MVWSVSRAVADDVASSSLSWGISDQSSVLGRLFELPLPTAKTGAVLRVRYLALPPDALNIAQLC